MQNALSTQLGYPSNLSRIAGVFSYLLNDTFTTNRSAGAVNSTAAEPGPGTRTVTDTNSKLSLSGGAAAFATGGVTNGDPGISYAPFVRVGGRILAASISVSASTAAVGWDFVAGGQITESVRFPVASLSLTVRINATALAVGAFVAGTEYQVTLVLRSSAGMHFFIKGGAFTNHTLLYSSSIGTSGAYIPAAGVESTTAIAALSYIRVPVTRWLPTPLASDGFSAWGTTDGLGHAETTGLGSGGSGEAWTENAGTWTVSSGAATASALDVPVIGKAIATVDTATADCIATVKVTRVDDAAGLVVRYADSGNYVYAVHNGTNAQLVKVVIGVPTTLVNAAATYSAGAELRVICDATKFRLYYNNVLIGSEQTIADAGLASGTQQGLYTSDTGNTFDDLRIYARGTGGEYSALDSF